MTAVKTLSAERVQSVTREVERLTKTIEACAEFLEKFGEKGFLSRMMSGELDAKKFAELDRRLAAHSTELGSALDLQNLAMQERIFSQMEQLASLVADQEAERAAFRQQKLDQAFLLAPPQATESRSRASPPRL